MLLVREFATSPLLGANGPDGSLDLSRLCGWRYLLLEWWPLDIFPLTASRLQRNRRSRFVNARPTAQQPRTIASAQPKQGESPNGTGAVLRGQCPIKIHFFRSRGCLVAFGAFRRAAFGVRLWFQIAHGERAFLFRCLRLARFVRHGRI